jgi:hypothetical protein
MKLLLSIVAIASFLAACSHIQPIAQETLTCSEAIIAPLIPQFLADLHEMDWTAAVEKDVLRYGEATAACVFAWIETGKGASASDETIARAREAAAQLHYRGQF